MKKRLLLSCAAACCLTAIILGTVFTVASHNRSVVILKAKDVFQTEQEYQKFIIANDNFKNLNFSLLTVEPGDNFWKIAKKFNTNIDSLIGMNPYWESLNATTSQKIVVASIRGSLIFLKNRTSAEAIAKALEIDPNEVILPHEGFSDMFSSTDAPIPVFIMNKKPDMDNMTDSMADQFALREMFRSPLGGRLTSFFGNRVHPIFQKYGFHNGIDIAAPMGTAVGASRGGTVIAAGWMGGFGKAVVIQHDNGLKTLYGHLSSIAVREGTKVKAGQFVGRVGSTGYSTGPHLHFTIWQNDRLINPLKVLW